MPSYCQRGVILGKQQGPRESSSVPETKTKSKAEEKGDTCKVAIQTNKPSRHTEPAPAVDGLRTA